MTGGKGGDDGVRVSGRWLSLVYTLSGTVGRIWGT